MNFKKLTDLNLAGKRVFIRADLNVPQDDAGAITDDTRIRASVPGIVFAVNAGGAPPGWVNVSVSELLMSLRAR